MSKRTITIKGGMSTERSIREAVYRARKSQSRTAARGACELLQNACDAQKGVPIHERRIDVYTKSADNYSMLKVQDFGPGVGDPSLLVTLGATTKEQSDPDDIGEKGIGWLAGTHPDLEPISLVLTTRDEEGCFYRLTLLFNEQDQTELPETEKVDLPDARFDFGTLVEVRYRKRSAAKKCLHEIENYAETLPHQVYINGERAYSVWAASPKNMFESSVCRGYIETQEDAKTPQIRVLVKYAPLCTMSLATFARGSRDSSYTISDFKSKAMPYHPYTRVVVNSYHLRTTIARDAWYLDHHHGALCSRVADEVLCELGRHFRRAKPFPEIVLANLYALSVKAKQALSKGLSKNDATTDGELALAYLIHEPIFRVHGRAEPVSLVGIQSLRVHQKWPIFYSVYEEPLSWLGGAYEHDFVVAPPEVRGFLAVDDLYKTILSILPDADVFDLGALSNGDTTGLTRLISSGVVTEDALTPKTTFATPSKLSDKEMSFLEDLNHFLAAPHLMDAIVENIQIPIRRLEVVYFDADNTAVTGLFDKQNRPIREAPTDRRGRVVRLGLNRKNRFLRALIKYGGPQRTIYATLYIVSELLSSMKRLSPFSRVHTLFRNTLKSSLRDAVIALSLEQEGSV